MSVQTEKSFLIDLLQNSNDASFIQKVKNFVLKEMEAIPLTENQKKEFPLLDKRMVEHQQNPKSGLDAFDFSAQISLHPNMNYKKLILKTKMLPLKIEEIMAFYASKNLAIFKKFSTELRKAFQVIQRNPESFQYRYSKIR